MDTTEMPGLPRGICGDCCSRLGSADAPLSSVAVRPGVLLHASYCAHNEAVASFLSGPGLGQRWTIASPIAADELQAYLQARAETLAATLELTRGPGDPGKWN